MENIVLVITAVTLLGGAFQIFLILAVYRLVRQADTYRTGIYALRRDQQLLSQDISSFGHCLERFEQQLLRLQESQEQTRMPSDPVYRVARNLMRKGAGVDELVKNCGLARGEAELMDILYRHRSDIADGPAGETNKTENGRP